MQWWWHSAEKSIMLVFYTGWTDSYWFKLVYGKTELLSYSTLCSFLTRSAIEKMACGLIAWITWNFLLLSWISYISIHAVSLTMQHYSSKYLQQQQKQQQQICYKCNAYFSAESFWPFCRKAEHERSCRACKHIEQFCYDAVVVISIQYLNLRLQMRDMKKKI